ncbi:type II toxin-antitoxin system RelE/ParE family toxin [uncultured Rhodospira sp.]|uniref:type II toxin-antitoxin system RelE/ParE family toxin n=1 Tax=uncultured Rhodospira sp. TaxID=1936189 RepID=UPI0026397268|nr:type II toxin-antitoxin system RelE/ParE family toxin [uncultured Rhodospira sp.]
MTGREGRWIVRPTKKADKDFADILYWTLRQFGKAQATAYRQTIESALEALQGGPTVPGIRRLDGVSGGLMTLHVARQGRKGRHLIVFRVAPNTDHPTLDILRILHDAMDLPRHVPDTEDGSPV